MNREKDGIDGYFWYRLHTILCNWHSFHDQFNDTTLVFKVGGKMFPLLGLSTDSRGLTLIGEPELAVEVREEHI